MKKILPLLLIGIAGVMMLSSCSGDDLQATPSKESLSVGTEFFIEANSESYSISVTANCQWTVELLSGWERLQLGTRSADGDGVILLATPKNDETTSREAYLQVVSQTGVIVRKIHVQQRGIDPYIQLSQTQFEQTFRAAESLEVTITSNAYWQITGGAPGFSCDTENGKGNATIHFSVEENLVESDRTAVFTISSVDPAQARPAVAEVTIHQAARTIDIQVTPTDHQVEADGASFPVAVSCTDKWEIAGGADGFTCDVTGGEGDGTVTVTVASNPYETVRSATFTFRTVETSVTKTATLTVVQAGKQVQLNVSSQGFTAQAIGGDYQVEVLCNAAWFATADASWLTVTPNQGEENGFVTIICEQNTSTSPRQSAVIISAGSQGQYTKTIVVEQQPGAVPSVEQPIIGTIDKYNAAMTFSYQSATSVVTTYGICYATHENPTVADKVISQTGNDTGAQVSFNLSGLESGTEYYARAFARNATGIAYSEQVSFTTAGNAPNPDDPLLPYLIKRK